MRSIVLALVFASGAALALETPKPGALDSRVRSIVFNPDQVVSIDAVIGISTQIVFEDGERVDPANVVFGVAKAFQDPEVIGNTLYLKPTLDLPLPSNMHVVTDRRKYLFRLRFRENESGALYSVRFVYPDSERRELKERAEQLAVQAALKDQHAAWNLNYTGAGDAAIAPVNAWDNGIHTYLKFAPATPLPAVEAIMPDGKPANVNWHIEGEAKNIMVLHTINPVWHLRLGDSVYGVVNEKPAGIGITTGTTSPSVQRVIKGDSE